MVLVLNILVFKRRPVKMIHAEVFSSRSEATKAEAAFKNSPENKRTLFTDTLNRFAS